jgi:5-methylcytosine-specific restriction endonuclease McrA
MTTILKAKKVKDKSINGLMFYYKELSIQEGFEVLHQSREIRNVDGMKVSAPSGAALFHHYNETYKPLTCFKCGVVADRWIVKHQHNDRDKPPVVELFAYTKKNRLVMMTRDHIIPKSWGGLDLVENLRPACEPCNRDRKNVLDVADKQFMVDNPHLYNYKEPREYKNEEVSNGPPCSGDPSH